MFIIKIFTIIAILIALYAEKANPGELKNLFPPLGEYEKKILQAFREISEEVDSCSRHLNKGCIGQIVYSHTIDLNGKSGKSSITIWFTDSTKAQVKQPFGEITNEKQYWEWYQRARSDGRKRIRAGLDNPKYKDCIDEAFKKINFPKPKDEPYPVHQNMISRDWYDSLQEKK